jgi:hypothetical protein
MKLNVNTNGKETTLYFIPETPFEESILTSMNLSKAEAIICRPTDKDLQITIKNHGQ